MRSRAICLVAAVFMCGVTARPALADPVPAVFPVTITASTLAAVVKPYRFTFALYDAADGGTRLWSESKSYRLPASKRITHQLGSVNPGINPISPLFFDRQLWVEASAAGKIFPRVKLTVVPYAVRSELAGNIEAQVTAGQVDATGAASGDVLTANGDGAASWQPPAAGAGDITAIEAPAGSGLQGGTEQGVASLSLLQTCAAGEVLKWSGTAWACAPDVDTNSGGTVTGVTAGAGLTAGAGPTGGTIATSGTLAVDTAAIQARVGGTCAPGSSIRVIAADGSVTCEADDVSGGAGAGWALGGNAGTTPGTNFLGTTDNQALEVKVNSTRALRIEPTAGTPNLLAGYLGNEVTAPAGGAVIGGGGKSAETNRVTDDFGTVGGGSNNRAGDAGGVVTDAPYGTVGGGQANTASGTHATVGGGYTNTASGSYAAVGSGFGNNASAFFATVAGGQSNTASGTHAAVGGGHTNQASQRNATVGGGFYNQAGGTEATVGGGSNNAAGGQESAVGGGFSNRATGEKGVVAGGGNNTAGGMASSVPGGAQNAAGGDYSLAAGRQAVVRDATASGDANGDEGTFVWADAQGAPFTSTGPNQFLVRAQNGVGINTNNPSSALDVNGTVTATGLRLTTTPAAGYVLTSDAGGNGSWRPVAGGAGGTVTQVDTGAGLTGGPITGTGTVSVAPGGITNAMIADGTIALADLGQNGCGNGQVLSWNGTAWACAADADTDTGVNAVTSGGGITGLIAGRTLTLGSDATVQRRSVAPTCPDGQYLKAVAADGTPTCAADGTGTFAGWSVTGNAGTSPATNFIGTTDDVPFEVRVNNQRVLQLSPRASTPGSSTDYDGQNVLGGLGENFIAPGVTMATIAGGGGWLFDKVFGRRYGGGNRVYGIGGTIGGGVMNNAGDSGQSVEDSIFAVVGGGFMNSALRGHATVGGGYGNVAASYAATVGGGQGNHAQGEFTTVSGGQTNWATGGSATIPGGAYNFAGGQNSMASGCGAKVRDAIATADADGDEGTFVWADSLGGPSYCFEFTSTGPNQFLIRAGGGVGINKNNPTTALDVSGTIMAQAPGASGVAYIATGDRGIWGKGTFAGGTFSHPDNLTFWADVSTPSHKIRGTGAVSFVQNHPYEKDRVVVYAAPEGDEVAVYTRGSARLVNGVARVRLGSTFAWVANPDVGLTAHVTPRGERATLWVESVGTEELVVRGPAESSVAFDYVVYGLRIGFEEVPVVQPKLREAFLPDPAVVAQEVGGHADVRKSSSLERFRGMRAGQGETTELNLSRARALAEAIGHGREQASPVPATGAGPPAGAVVQPVDHGGPAHGSRDARSARDGVVTTDANGYATVELSEGIETRDGDYRYQLTVVDEADGEGFVQAKVVRGVAENRFTIRTSAPGVTVSWQVTGIRQDPYANAHRIPVEEEKPVADRGMCLHAEACGEQLAQGR